MPAPPGPPAIRGVTTLVTGAAGYLGSRLVDHLALGRNPVRAAVRKHVGYLATSDVCVGDLRNRDVAERACEGMEAVVHLAGANEAAFACEPGRAIADTVEAAASLATAAAAGGVKRVVYASTIHVYGAAMAPGAVVAETELPAPTLAYAVGRLAAEHAITALAGPDVEVVVLRLSNTVGPPLDPAIDRWALVCNDLCRQVATSGSLRLLTPGHQWRDFVAVDDVVAILAGASPPGSTGGLQGRPGPLPTGTYNLASGLSTRVRDLALMVKRAATDLGEAEPPLLAPPLPDTLPEPFRLVVDKLARAGWPASSHVTDAVRATMAFCLEHRHQLG